MEREIFVHNAFPAGGSLVCCCLLSYCLQRFVPSPSDGGVDNALLALICFVGNQICPVGNRSGFVQRHLIRSKSGLVQLSWCLWCHFGAIIMVQIWCKSDKTLLLPVVLLWCNSPGAIRMVLVPLVRWVLLWCNHPGAWCLPSWCSLSGFSEFLSNVQFADVIFM